MDVAVRMLGLSCLAASLVFGQAATASIEGTVLDPSGTIVPEADVTVANNALGLERQLKTSGAGIFTATALPPSPGYTVTVTKAGFAKYTVNSFDLAIGQSLSLHVTLNIASTGTQVNVVAEAPIVETSKTDVSGVVSTHEIENLPINGRRVDAFVLLQPGVTNDASFGLLTFRGTAGGNTFLTDGIDTTNNFYDENAGRTRSYNISQDAIQEFQVVTSNYLPEYGNAMGGVVNTITRSGTNSIHGTAYWFFRNRTLDATDPTALGVNPPEWRHQAGLSVGGPIKKDKLFYFFNGELQRRYNPIVSSNISSTLFNAAGAPTGATNPITGCGGSSYPVKASTAQCQTAIAFLETRVAPQLVPRTVDENLLFGKVDYQINERNHWNAEFNYLDFRSPNGIQTQSVLTTGAAIGNNANTTVFDRTLKSGLTTVIGANAVNEFRFGMFKDRQYDPNSPSLEPPTGPTSFSITTGSLSNIGYATSYPRLHPSELRFELSDTYAWTLGRHVIKFGIDWSHTEDYDLQRANQFGTYTYSNINAFALDFSNPVNGKNWNSYSQTFGDPLWDGSTQDIGIFGQDEIHVTPKLTISPGLRFEYQHLPQPTPAQVLGSLNIPADWPETNHLYYKPWSVAPRIGFAYAMNSNTVVRGSYGMFYNRYISQIVDGLAKGNGSYQPSYSLQSNVASQFAAGPVFPNFLRAQPNAPATAPTVEFDLPGFRNAYSEQAQLSIQRELNRSTSLTVSGIWSRGLHIVTGYNANLATPIQSYTYLIDNSSGQQAGAFTIPIYTRSQLINPNYNGVYATTSNANSWYNGLIISVNHRYTGWFQGTASYTWSRAIDYNLGGAAGASGSNGVLFAASGPSSLYNNDFADEKGTAATDQRHKLILEGIVNPTFTHGHSWFERTVINGWQFSFISTFASSFPINSTIGGVSSTTLPIITGQTFFATSTINGLGGFNAQRVPFQPVDNLDVGPTYRTDARLAKFFPITERLKVELAFEAANVFNHLIVEGASPLQEQEYTLTKNSTGQSVLVPYPLYTQLLQTQSPPDGTTARRAQASLRIIF
ncbi:MAG TPA: TonB-dependent receptor [Bryobacteraceae bacterium]|nr:TonB-dependent receptor [Bryobacteraceae bacterium]